MEKILENYPLFYDILFTTTMLSNDSSSKYKEDASKIIEFFCEINGIDNETTSHFKKVILEDQISTATVKDYNVLCNMGYDFKDDNLLNTINIKCTVLKDLNFLSQYDKYKNWFNYSFVALYTAETRFKQIKDAAINGNLFAARTLSILYALGIGTQKNIKRAIIHMRQCAYWGDKRAINTLPHLYKLDNDMENFKLYHEVSLLSDKLLDSCITIVPDILKKDVSKEACETYALISSIKFDIIAINHLENIIYSFVEVMVMESISYEAKMNYINNFKSFKWQEASNGPVIKEKLVGFLGKVGKNE